MCLSHVERVGGEPIPAGPGPLVAHDPTDFARPVGKCFVCDHDGPFAAALTRMPSIGLCQLCHEAASHAASRL